MDGTSTQQPADVSANQGDDNPPPIPTEAQLPVKPLAAAVPAQRRAPPRANPEVPTAKVRVATTLDMVTGHWCQPNVSISISPSEFYDLVTKEVIARNFPSVLFSRVYWQEEAFTGAKREYLRVQRARIVFDICAAPQGAGSFFSSWLCIVPPQVSAAHLLGNFVGMILLIWLPPIALIYGIALFIGCILWWGFGRVSAVISYKSDFLLGLTGLGPILKFIAEFKPTYYKIDAAIIFQSLVQDATLTVIDRLCEKQNARRLTEQERAPVLREFMKK